jgi:hypothetical protein
MPVHFDLVITADTANHSAEFRLLDAAGAQLAYRKTDFNTLSVSHRRGRAGSRGGRRDRRRYRGKDARPGDLRETLALRVPAHAAHPVAGCFCQAVGDDYAWELAVEFYRIATNPRFQGRSTGQEQHATEPKHLMPGYADDEAVGYPTYPADRGMGRWSVQECLPPGSVGARRSPAPYQALRFHDAAGGGWRLG